MRTRTLALLLISFAEAFSQENKVVTPKGCVSAAHPLATQAGIDILLKGGNAFDTAVAIASTLNVVEPMMSGLGGYGTILIYDGKGKRIRYLNSSGKFPVSTNSDLMRAPTENYMANRLGAKSISTPGNLNSWAALQSQYGKLPWNTLFQNAIQHAEKGFAISSGFAGMLSFSFKDFSPYSKSFYGKGGVPLKDGELLIQADLGKTFRIISEQGSDPFYKGAIAESIDKKMRDSGSFLSLADLKANKAEWWEPIKINYRGYEVYTSSLPSNAFAAFVSLGLMQTFKAGEMKHNSPDYLHLFAEMTKKSYKARLKYSLDPDIRPSPLDSLLSAASMTSMASSLDRKRASTFTLPFAEESKNTTHFVVIDSEGNIVSATQTLGNLFGSHIMVDGTGIWMNNSMAYSTFEPKGNPMDAFPGRHKLSGDCPVIILKDHQPWAALGSPGGHTITQNVPQIIFNLIDFKMSMQEAIDASKIVFAEPDQIICDSFLSEESVNALAEKGHHVRKGSIGNAQGIKIIRDGQGKIVGYEGGADRRGEGKAAEALRTLKNK